MKKYLGSYMTAYAAIMVIALFIPMFIGFPIVMLTSSVEPATILMTVGCLAGLAVWVYYFATKMYWKCCCWGRFGNDKVTVSPLFGKKRNLLYKDFKHVGIGYYVHGVLGSRTVGSHIYYIFLSDEILSTELRQNINLLPASRTKIMVQFKQDIYEYLLQVLPSNHAAMLQRDYRMMIANKKKQ
ncbi:MAG: hypothetical protein E7664_05445 [Ruminococcaceae bacterium]|nr:hypothetical protein [Oscillospiraceae bacterium]